MNNNLENIEKLDIRKMGLEDVEFAIEMAAAEGWNPGIHDGEIFYETDPEGFFIAEIEGEPVGCASAVAYDNSYGFFGLYVVKPGFRGKGIGMKLTEKCLEYVGERNLGLDGVVENEKKYQQVMKFRSFYSNMRFEGTAGGDITGEEIPEGLTKISEVPFENLLEYEKQMFPAPRPVFLEKWINQPDSFAFASFEAGTLKGYGVIRKCRLGYKIGPLFADDESIAEKLFRALNVSVSGETIYFDVPEPNRKAMELAEKYGMKVMFKTIRMYNKEDPGIKLDRVYGVTTFELG